MIRLFIGNEDGTNLSLFKEVPVPIFPNMETTPIPVIILPTFEVNLEGTFKLESEKALFATTQNNEQFNIIAEGESWSYSNPDHACCSHLRETASNGINTINEANTSLDGSGAIVPVIKANVTNGNIINRITIKALQSTHPGMVRLFINDGHDNYLYKEVIIPESTQASNIPSYKHVIEGNFYMQKDFSLGASTQLSESFALTIESVMFSYA